MKKLIFLSMIFFPPCVWLSCKKQNEYKNLDCTTVPTYSATIKTIIDLNCCIQGCHAAGSANGNYSNYEGLLIRVNNGMLSKRVLYTKDMPKNAKLSLEDRKKIKCWLDNGAPKD